MKSINFLFLLAISILLFIGCSANQAANNKIVITDEPKWIADPYFNLPKDTIAAVGCARSHFKGKSAQRKLAISRAIDEIATQVKTTVNNITLRNRTNGLSSTSSSSLQSVDNIKVKTKILDIYTDKSSNMCAWVKKIN
jgi:hypothetical protein